MSDDTRDVDFDRNSPHHTLGKGPLQASPGNHDHDEKYRPITYDPFTTGDTKLSYAPADNVTWFEAGASLLRTGPTAALFALFGTTYGAVDVDHFNLPDSRGDFLRVASATKAPGFEDGSNTKVIASNNLPNHTHGAGSLATDTGTAHDHTAGTLVANVNRRAAAGTVGATSMGSGTAQADFVANVTGTTGTAGSGHTHGLSGNTSNGGFANDPINVEPLAHYLRLLIHV